ncbi:MAG: hypothetical protein R2751_07425 [Bacteroidales bacterium]
MLDKIESQESGTGMILHRDLQHPDPEERYVVFSRTQLGNTY